MVEKFESKGIFKTLETLEVSNEGEVVASLEQQDKP